jgi:hypothetical protein
MLLDCLGLFLISRPHGVLIEVVMDFPKVKWHVSFSIPQVAFGILPIYLEGPL